MIDKLLCKAQCQDVEAQGEDDEYGTMAQIEAIAAGATASAGVELLKLADCRHSAHKDQTVAVIEAISRFTEVLDIGVPPAPTIGLVASPTEESGLIEESMRFAFKA